MIKYLFSFALIIASFSSLAQSSWDLRTLENINLTRNFDMDKPLNALSNSADYLAVGIPVGLLTAGFIKGDAALKKEGFNAALTTFATYGVGFVLKKAVDRDRPYIEHPHIKNYREFSGSSFPSGSTSIAFATATNLSMAYPKWYVIVPSALYASTVGYSRLHLGAHYPSDVLAGAAIGMGTAFVSRKLNQLVNNEKKKRKLKLQKLE